MTQAETLTQQFGSALPPEQLHARLRERALASSYFFGKFVLGFKDLTDVHIVMADWLASPARRKLGLAPRGHLKSSLWTIADCLRLATRDPNLRILIVNETERLPGKWIGQMQATILENEIYRWLFPEVIPDPAQVAWNKAQLELRRDVHHAQATIEAYGVGGASTGNHYELIHEDDLVGKKARDEEATMKRAIEQHQLAESLLVDPERDTIRTVGTRWHPNDLVDWMLRHETDLDFFKLGCRHPNGEPIWPERFPNSRLHKLRLKYGAAFFALLYENEAIAEGSTEFRREWLRWWHYLGELPGERRPPEDESPVLVLERPDGYGGVRHVRLWDCERVTLVDPGISPESKEARTAVVTAALTPPETLQRHTLWTPDQPDDMRALGSPYDVILLEDRAKALAPTQVIEAAHEAWRRWNSSIVAIEVFGAQMHLFYWAAQTFPNMPVRKIPMDSRRKKESRIREVTGSLAEQGRLYIHRRSTDFVDEFVTFPHGRTRDLLDALSWGPTVWAPPELSGENLEEDAEEEAIVRAEGLRDGRSPITGY